MWTLMRSAFLRGNQSRLALWNQTCEPLWGSRDGWGRSESWGGDKLKSKGSRLSLVSLLWSVSGGWINLLIPKVPACAERAGDVSPRRFVDKWVSDVEWCVPRVSTSLNELVRVRRPCPHDASVMDGTRRRWAVKKKERQRKKMGSDLGTQGWDHFPNKKKKALSRITTARNECWLGY